MGYHIDNLTIHAFRGLKELKLEGLGRFNLLLGSNNTGKTTILEAIETYCRPLDIVPWILAAGRRESAEPDGSFADLEWVFPHAANSGRENSFRGGALVSGLGGFPLREASASYESIARLKKHSTPSGDVEYEQCGAGVELRARFEGTDASAKRYEIWFGEPLPLQETGPKMPVSTISPQAVRTRMEPMTLLSKAELSGMKPRVLDLIRALDPGIRDVLILSPHGRETIYVDHEQTGKAPLSIFGDGLRRVLLYSLTLLQLSGGVLLIDEMETSIHVSALSSSLRWMAEACRTFDVQLFATTHSLDAVDAVLDAEVDHLDDFVGFRLRRDAGRIECQRLYGDLLRRLRFERGLDVRV